MIGTLIFKRFLTSNKFNAPAPHLAEFFEKRSQMNRFDTFFISKLKIVSASVDSGSMLVELKVDESLCNVNGSLHGGAISSLIDCVSTAALFNSPARKPGVSVDMSLSFIKPALIDDTILIEGKVLKAGNKLAYLTASIYKKDIGDLYLNKKQIIATGTHTKFLL